MKRSTYPKGINTSLIKRATEGEEEALLEILQIYEPFPDALVARDIMDEDGRTHHVINEDWKIQVQIKLMEAIRTKWREII